MFFYAAHDPTELNRQGPDSGTQYRSAIFFTNAAQKKIADDYIAQLDHAKTFPEPIVTQVVPLKGFYPAKAYHQNYLERHPDNPYIVINDLPKLDLLRKSFPSSISPKRPQAIDAERADSQMRIGARRFLRYVCLFARVTLTPSGRVMLRCAA